MFPWNCRCQYVEFNRPPSWSLCASETWDSTPLTWDRGKMLQSPYYFCPFSSTLLPHHLYPLAFCTLPSFACIKRPRWRPVKLASWHLRSHGKIGENSLAALLPIIISTCLGNLRTVSCCLIENDQDNEIFFRWLQGLLMEVNLMSSRQCMEIV